MAPQSHLEPIFFPVFFLDLCTYYVSSLLKFPKSYTCIITPIAKAHSPASLVIVAPATQKKFQLICYAQTIILTQSDD